MSTNAEKGRGPSKRKAPAAVITEEDLARLDTTSVVDQPLEATDPVNAAFLKFGTVICVILTVVMTALVTTAVILRYFFNSSIPIAAEGPQYLFPWLIAGGAIVAQAQMSHVAVDYAMSRMSFENYRRTVIGIWVFVAILLAYLTYLGLYMAPPMAAQSTPIMGLPQLGSFGAFIVMTFVMCLQAIARVVHIVRNGPPERITDLTDPDAAKHMPELHHG